MAPRVRKETLSSRIVSDLRAVIVRGDLAPGEKINLDRLREIRGCFHQPAARGDVTADSRRAGGYLKISAAIP